MTEAKALLRQHMCARLRGITMEDRIRWSVEICALVAAHPAYQSARSVALFDGMPGEPDLVSLWQVAPRRFFYPRVEGETLVLIRVKGEDELQMAVGHIYREPTGSRAARPSEVDLVLVPGLAFTPGGKRLGRGGGFYDRLLESLPSGTQTLGVCFAAQSLDDLPTEPHDRRVHEVISCCRS